jgi:hypothetical protein
VREESHLEEMRDAIRGDFERLAERRGEQELMRVTESENSEESAVTAEGPQEPKPEVEAEPGQEIAEETEPPEPSPEEAERRSWLARLFSA